MPFSSTPWVGNVKKALIVGLIVALLVASVVIYYAFKPRVVEHKKVIREEEEEVTKYKIGQIVQINSRVFMLQTFDATCHIPGPGTSEEYLSYDLLISTSPISNTCYIKITYHFNHTGFYLFNITVWFLENVTEWEYLMEYLFTGEKPENITCWKLDDIAIYNITVTEVPFTWTKILYVNYTDYLQDIYDYFASKGEKPQYVLENYIWFAFQTYYGEIIIG